MKWMDFPQRKIAPKAFSSQTANRPQWKALTWEIWAEAIDIGHSAGIDRVGLITARTEQAQR